MRRRMGTRGQLAYLAMMLLQVFGMTAPVWAAVPAAPLAGGSPFADVTICAAHLGSTDPASHHQNAPPADHRDHLCPHCQLCCGHPLAVTVTPAALSLPGSLQRLGRVFVPTSAPHGPPQSFLYARAPPTPT